MDGSGTYPADARRRRVGLGVFGVSASGECVGSMFGAAPLLIQDVPGAEAFSLLTALQSAMPPIRVWTNCQGNIDAVS